MEYFAEVKVRSWQSLFQFLFGMRWKMIQTGRSFRRTHPPNLGCAVISQTSPPPFIKCASPLSRREKTPRPHLLSGPETYFSIIRDSALQTSTTSCQCCSAVTDAPCFHYKQAVNLPCVHSGMVTKSAQDCLLGATLLGVAERPSGTHL